MTNHDFMKLGAPTLADDSQLGRSELSAQAWQTLIAEHGLADAAAMLRGGFAIGSRLPDGTATSRCAGSSTAASRPAS
jgi:phage tail protein X